MIDPQVIGDTLNYILTNKSPYKELKTAYSSNDTNTQSTNINHYITEVYKQYLGIDVNLYDKVCVNFIQGGDILVANKFYVVTQSVPYEPPTTWPRIPDSIINNFIVDGMRQFNVIRPIKLVDDKLESRIKKISMEIVQSTDNKTHRILDEKEVRIQDADNDIIFDSLGDGALQIGDLIFLVDPTQISFNTQNGYQYFPTIRTQGNPKIPTVGQVKNISITLIFPNQDSINYQLLNLYAMYRRAPFVNLRNKDICNFFKTLLHEDEWLSIALESIQIQSVRGFPNTLQAAITILPFDCRGITEKFSALLSMRDVERQQALLYRNKELDDIIRKSEAKLYEQSVVPERFSDLIIGSIRSDYDFRNSLPFRAFYQSLIAERTEIKDNLGQVIYPVSSDGSRVSSSYDITKFRPTNPENRLHEYNEEDNKVPVYIKYRAISDDFSTISKVISEQRLTEQERLLSELTTLYNATTNRDELWKELVNTFYTTKDFFEFNTAKISAITNQIPEILARYNITLDTQDDHPIRNLLDYFIQGGLAKIGLSPMLEATQDTWNLIQGKFSVAGSDAVGLKTLLTYNSVNKGIDNGFGVRTLDAEINKIFEWISADSTGQRRKDFSACMKIIAQSIISEFTGEDSNLLVISPSSDNDIFKVNRLPLKEYTVEIDNRKDIITDWSLIFSNKFVPINLQAYDQPYYQHIGSDDAVLSLSITSTSEKPDVTDDLKTQLSLLSTRLRDSIKIIMMTAPELATYLDSRLTIFAPTDNNEERQGFIFNCFGIKKVVFDSSNTVTIDGQPNSWNTTVNFTQANFTISDYHNISRVPTNDKAVEQIANIIARLERNGENFKVVKYLKKSKTPENIKSEELQLTLNELVRIRFLKVYGDSIEKYIKQAEKESSATKGISRFIPFYTSTSTVPQAGTSQWSSIIGAETAQKIKNGLKEQLDIEEQIDTISTEAINNLVSNSPEFRKIIDYILSRLDVLLYQKSEAIKLIIEPNRTFFQKMVYYATHDLKAPNAVQLSIFGTVLGFSNYLGNVFLKTFVQSLQGEVKEKLINKFDSFFSSLEDEFANNIFRDFSEKILRDPTVYNKFITPDIVGEPTYKSIEANRKLTPLNCYNDFDIPIYNNDIIIGPDFYLFNPIMDGVEKRIYIDASLKRYAKVGKLCAMMTFTEASELLGRYNQLINNSSNLKDEVKTSASKIITSDLNTMFNTDSIDQLIDILKYTRDVISMCKNNVNEQKIISDVNQRILNDFDKNNKNNKDYVNERKRLQAKLEKSSKGLVADNMDVRKFNLIYTARMKTLIELMEVYNVINDYMLKKINKNTLIKQVLYKNNKANRTDSKYDNQSFLSKGTTEEASIQKLHSVIESILINAENMTSELLEQTNYTSKKNITQEQKEIAKHLRSQNVNGLAETYNEKFVALPGIYRLENYLYNKIGFFIRLNTVLKDAVAAPNGKQNIDFSTIPEIGYLDFWNFRTQEENDRKVKILKDFNNSDNLNKNTTIKMFPTFKIFFVEEDKGLIRNFDDYYTHNAIQSIEIISNKNSPSTTAIIRLSNITGNLTDRMSLLRESEKLFGYSIGQKGEPDNLFFGTLDLKPGTGIIIKMGYAPYDNLLTSVFQGRIIEMNNGPNVELVCQSFGAQLNHQIVAEKFGLLSTSREHGDVASAILDLIPGLEKLGKTEMFGLANGIQPFTGKNIRNVRGKFGDRLLLSNLIGATSSLTFAQDNPRDENIYLNYSSNTNIYHHPTFDWVVFNQSVWDALKEITLYHRNKIVTVKSFNDDSLSNNNHIRETLVIGDKAGYYKYTDAFSISSLNIREVEEAIKTWESIKAVNTSFDSLIKDDKGQIIVFSYLYTTVLTPTITLTPNGRKLYSFLQNRINCLVMAAYVLSQTQAVGSSIDIYSNLMDMVSNNKIIDTSTNKLVGNLIKFGNLPPIPENELSTYNFSEGNNYGPRLALFLNIIHGEGLTQKSRIGLKNFAKSPPLTPELFYAVQDRFSNTDKRLLSNPQYKKIQTHHLVTDTSNIIANNISLNSNFSNLVNVYYTGEPKIKNASLDNMDDEYISKKLSLWTVKAFGEQKDESSRPLNSYQKNIDTNWFDIHSKTTKFFEDYHREKFNPKDNSSNAGDINIPRWDRFPSFVVVGVNLLKNEVEKMYQGTIEIIGNPAIKPFDILHIQDYTNDTHGVVEVEEVIHTFTPDRGFRTVITPNLITYDRDPVQVQDVQTINQIYDFINFRSIFSSAFPLEPAYLALGFVTQVYNSTIGTIKKYHKAVFDQMGHIMGRDCINFTSLLYHGMPYMAGFDGIDYTSLKTLMNHNVADMKDQPITQYMAYRDIFKANATTGWNPKDYGLYKQIVPWAY